MQMGMAVLTENSWKKYHLKMTTGMCQEWPSLTVPQKKNIEQSSAALPKDAITKKICNGKNLNPVKLD